MRIYTLFVLGIIVSIKAGFAQSISLHNLTENEISKGFLFLADSSQSLSLKDVQGKYKNSFLPVNANTKKDEKIGVYWLKLSVTNDIDFDREWIFDFENWSFVSFYYQEKGQYLLKKTGHNYPFRKRDYPVANKNYIKLPLRAGEVKECLVRLDYRLRTKVRTST